MKIINYKYKLRHVYNGERIKIVCEYPKLVFKYFHYKCEECGKIEITKNVYNKVPKCCNKYTKERMLIVLKAESCCWYIKISSNSDYIDKIFGINANEMIHDYKVNYPCLENTNEKIRHIKFKMACIVLEKYPEFLMKPIDIEII